MDSATKERAYNSIHKQNTKAEKNYTLTEKEALAIFHYLRQWSVNS